MPCSFTSVDPLACQDITNEPKVWLQVKNIPVMPNWIGQTRVSAVRSSKKIKGLPGQPLIHLYLGQMFPTERSRRIGLIYPIDIQSVVCSGPAKAVSMIIIHTNISRGTGIDEHGMPVHG